jgi:hypothetical protein
MIGDNHISPRMSLSPIMRQARRDELMTQTAECMTQTASGPLFCDVTQTACWQRFGPTHVANDAKSRAPPPGDGCGRKTRLQRYISPPPLPPLHKRGKSKCALGGRRLAGPRSEPELLAQNGLRQGTKPHRQSIGSIPKHGATDTKGRARDATGESVTRAASSPAFRVTDANHFLAGICARR